MALISETPAWRALANHVAEVEQTHLRELLQDQERNASLCAEHDGIFLDFSRQKVTLRTMEMLFDLAEAAGLSGKIQAMAAGEHLNNTEDRAVMHVALRAAPQDTYMVDGVNVVPAVHQVLQKIKTFTEKVRNGEFRGATGKLLTDVVAIGIGGSYLGAEFVAEALHTDAKASEAARGRRLSFLSNVDPIGVARALEGFNPETTLVVVISKTFTTAETMLNARTCRRWIVDALGADAVGKHVVAVSTATDKVVNFGIDRDNIFEFWDWVGGRYSVTSAVGILPLALQYSFDILEQFLAGARNIDQHFFTAAPRQNLPVLLGLLGVWNASFLNYSCRALLPYCQALHRFAPHIQQVDMESNGKRVAKDGTVLNFGAGPINFGEPGTNGQHSFYQLLHQGRVVPCDFIGFVESQCPIEAKEEVVSNHDELMSNFFAQPDALACGKTEAECKAEGVPAALVPHKVFSGNRPSSSLLLPRLNAYTTGQLLALFEHRTAVEGFIWNVNSFDQWGVELGKVLASEVRKQLSKSRKENQNVAGFNSSTTSLLNRYLGRASHL